MMMMMMAGEPSCVWLGLTLTGLVVVVVVSLQWTDGSQSLSSDGHCSQSGDKVPVVESFVDFCVVKVDSKSSILWIAAVSGHPHEVTACWRCT